MKAAWLYAQFVVSKTVSTSRRAHVGLTVIRDSDIRHESFTERAPQLGGWVEFYRSPDRVNWTPTGINVPDYPKLAQIWWQQIGDVNSGAFTAQEAMDRLAEEMDVTMARMQAADEASNTYGGCGPRLNAGSRSVRVARQAPMAPPPPSRTRTSQGRPSLTTNSSSAGPRTSNHPPKDDGPGACYAPEPYRFRSTRPDLRQIGPVCRSNCAT